MIFKDGFWVAIAWLASSLLKNNTTVMFDLPLLNCIQQTIEGRNKTEMTYCTRETACSEPVSLRPWPAIIATNLFRGLDAIFLQHTDEESNNSHFRATQHTIPHCMHLPHSKWWTREHSIYWSITIIDYKFKYIHFFYYSYLHFQVQGELRIVYINCREV